MAGLVSTLPVGEVARISSGTRADKVVGNTQFTRSYGIVAGVLGALFLIVLARELLRHRKQTYKPETATMPGSFGQNGDEAAFLDVETPASALEMTPWEKAGSS